MKKLLGIIVLGLLWCNILSAKILNIENKIQLEVPPSHKYIKYENKMVREAFEELLDTVEGWIWIFFWLDQVNMLTLKKQYWMAKI